MTVNLSDVAESRQYIAERVVLRLRGNSGEDAVDYAFKMTETMNTEVGSLEYEVPRQIDASMEMVMLSNQETVNRLLLGEYIIKSGYDWSARDLSDVSVALDLEKQQVMVTVSGWDGVVIMDIVI